MIKYNCGLQSYFGMEVRGRFFFHITLEVVIQFGQVDLEPFGSRMKVREFCINVPPTQFRRP